MLLDVLRRPVLRSFIAGYPSSDDHGPCGEGPHCLGTTIAARDAAREP